MFSATFLSTFAKVQVSISSTFDARLFRMKLLCAAFLILQFGILIFWRKNIGTKAACRILVKFTSVAESF